MPPHASRWTGEEQGLLGSREYVKMLKETGQLEKISAVFVDDGGTNYEGGLLCIESQVPYLAAATALVNGQFYSETDGKFLDVNVQASRRMGGGMSGGSSDHASFLSQGVPGFFWDEVGRADYGYGWHTQHDKIDLAIPEYLIQSATCAAITAYNLACAPTMLPRPEPRPAGEEGSEAPRRRQREQQPANSGRGGCIKRMIYRAASCGVCTEEKAPGPDRSKPLGADPEEIRKGTIDESIINPSWNSGDLAGRAGGCRPLQRARTGPQGFLTEPGATRGGKRRAVTSIP